MKLEWLLLALLLGMLAAGAAAIGLGEPLDGQAYADAVTAVNAVGKEFAGFVDPCSIAIGPAPGFFDESLDDLADPVGGYCAFLDGIADVFPGYFLA